MTKNHKIVSATGVLLFAVLACARTTPTSTPVPQPTSISTAVISPGEDAMLTLNFGGIERSYILHIPSLYDASKPTPLMLSFHGGGGNAENQLRLTDDNELADEQGFIVVYPNGTGQLDNVLTWNGGNCCGYAVKNQIDDVGFVRALVTELQSQYNIDPKRIYATGFSNGGIMSYRLACEAADIFAAIAPISGTLNYDECKPSEPVSVIHFHGTDDTHLPYNGGVGEDSVAGVPFKSVEDSINFWLETDQCAKIPESETYSDIQHDSYTNCANGTAVELYTIIGGKHARPGSDGPAGPNGDEPTQTISASEIIWEFFVAHPKP
jgi:polyhydroxybutyrate depolymerase